MTKLIKRKPIMGPVHRVGKIMVNGKPLKEVDPFSIQPDHLFFSDLHLHDRQEFTRIDPKTGLNFRLLEGLQILDQIIRICYDYSSIHTVDFLGDWFELKDKIPNHILIEYKKRMIDLLRTNVILISLMGNHDFNLPKYPTPAIFDGEEAQQEWTDKDGAKVIQIQSIEERKRNPFKFIKKAGWEDVSEIYFIPFQRKWEDFKKEWKIAHEFKPKPKIICMHQEIPDSEYETGKKTKGVWDLKTDPNILYLSGHLHKPQKVHGIQYLGSPYQVKFSDDKSPNRYIWLYNSKRGELAPYQLNYSKFISLDWNRIYKKEEIKALVNGNYIRIIGEIRKEDIDKESKINFKREAESFGAKAVIFNVKIIQGQTQSKIPKELIDNDKGIIGQYAKDNIKDSGLELKRLISVGEKAYESV